jgi:hypothetical protein
MTRQEIFEEAVKMVSEITGVSKTDMLSKNRYRINVNARKILTYSLRDKYNMGWTVMANMLNMNHASVIYSYKYVVNNAEYDKDIRVFKTRIDAIDDSNNMRLRKHLISIIKNSTVSVDTKLDRLIEIIRDEKGNISQHDLLQMEDYKLPKGGGKAIKEVEGI